MLGVWGVVVWLVLVPHCVMAATYYVATTGNNGNPGTQAQPWRTLAKAMTVLKAGDTLYLRDGTYDEGIDDNRGVPSGTSWTNAVTIASYPGETATLRPSGVETVINLPSESYIIFDGLDLDAINVSHCCSALDPNCTGDRCAPGALNGYVISVGSSGGHHIRFQNCDIRNGYSTNIITGGEYIEFINNKIHNSRFSYGFYLTSPNALIANNDIYDNAGSAIQIYNGSAPIADNIIVRNNRMWGNGFIRQQLPAVTVGSGSNCQIYNNLIYNNFGGIDVGGTNEQVYNNTIYNNAPRAAIALINAESPVIKNNIFYQNAGDIVDFGSTGPVITNNLMTNPQFVNASANDFRLQPGSPAIDAGLTIALVTTDIRGAARPHGPAYDIGAYEYGGVVTAPTPVPSLPVPQRLRRFYQPVSR